MFDAPFGRAHTLAPRRDDHRPHCGSEGLFIGRVPLLKSECAAAGKRVFSARPLAGVNRDLSRCYGLPVDAVSKIGGIAAVAKALNDGDPARACIAADLAKKIVADILAGVLGAALGPEVPVAETAKLIADVGYAAYQVAQALAPFVRAYFDAPKTLQELRDAATRGL
ncbi:MAG TPA: hypothetical protein VEH76_00200 [Methylocystis sp.]|nr:hypothetical protein [Methylocystis sp.]